MKKILCVILARGGSKSIPKKNIFKICGHPLISYSIEAAKQSKLISKIVVSTDDDETAKISRQYGAYTPFKRSKLLSGDKVPSVDALYDCVKRSEYFFSEKFDFVIELPCVSPLRDNHDVDEALKILIQRKCDSVISYVNTGEKHPTRLKRIRKNKVTNFCKDYPEADIGSRRQDFEPCFIRNGAIYAMTRDCIINMKSRNGKNSFPYIMSSEKSINIDEKFDLDIAKLLIQNGYCKNQPNLIEKNKTIIMNKKNENKTVLITAPINFFKSNEFLINNKYKCIYLENPNKKQLIKYLNYADGWICQPCPEYFINEEILKNAKRLKVISTPSTGTTHIDLLYCNRKSIKVYPITVSKKFTNIKASSEFTFLMCLLGFKNIINAIKKVRSGNWRNVENELRGNEIFGKKIGIFGKGRIGKNLSHYFKSMGAEVKFFDINKKNINKLSIKNDILKKSDLIAVCISYNKENYNFVDKKFFSKMKKGSIFINTSRGEVVNENSLISALKSKHIKCAYLDVVKNEQNLKEKNNILIEYSKKNENLIISPHMAGLTHESEEKAFAIASQNIIKNL